MLRRKSWRGRGGRFGPTPHVGAGQGDSGTVGRSDGRTDGQAVRRSDGQTDGGSHLVFTLPTLSVRPSDRPTVRPSDRPTVRPSDRPPVLPTTDTPSPLSDH